MLSTHPDQLDTLVTVLNLIRSGGGRTRPELARQSGLGRAVISQRLVQLVDWGLVESADLAPSTGGRAPRELRFRADTGKLLVADVGATSLRVGLTDLAAHPHAEHEETWDVAKGPEETLSRVEELFAPLLEMPETRATALWGIGVGLPGPVEFATGRPISPPIMPGWDRYPVRQRLSAKYGVPVWVDNDVNLMALGELHAGVASGESDVVYIKIGTGIGAGLISGGRLHRGAQGCAGDIGHIAVADEPAVVCRCGNVGCLETIAGGAALAREGLTAALEGRSHYLSNLLSKGRSIEAMDVAAAAQSGDIASVEMLANTGRHVGETLATLVNFFNPSLVVVGGGVASAGDALLATIREGVYRRSLPLATRDLRIVRSSLSGQEGVIGGAFMVLEELFDRQYLGSWIASGSPIDLQQVS